MFEELSIVRLASSLARHAGARHRVIAENVANADTPGYRARDVRGFSKSVNEAFSAEFAAKASRPGHVGEAAFHRAAYRPVVILDSNVQAAPNDNSVSLEAEMVKSVETQGQHALAVTVYRKAHELMRLGLGRFR